MISIDILIAISFVFFVQEVCARIDYEDCATQMEQYRSCVKQALQPQNKPSRLDQRRLEEEVRQCFLQQSCPDPFPPTELRQARTTCFQKVRVDTRHALEECALKSIDNFQLPQDENDGNDQMQTAASLMKSVKTKNFCPFNIDKNQLGACIKRAASIAQSKSTKNGSAVDLCTLSQQCGQAAGSVSAGCRQKWKSLVQPALCQCIDANPWLGRAARLAYQKCMLEKGKRVDAADPNPQWLESGMTAWCPAKGPPQPVCPEVAESSKVKVAPAKPTTSAANESLVTTTEHPLLGLFLQTSETPPAEIVSTESETVIETTPTLASTATVFPNQNFFNFLTNNSLIQGLVGGQAGVEFLQNVLSGKDLISALFPGSNLIEGNQINLANLFASLG